MGAVKNLCHDELEAKRYVDAEWPHLEDVFERFAGIIAENLCASDRAKGEHYVIAASLLPAFDDEVDKRTPDNG